MSGTQYLVFTDGACSTESKFVSSSFFIRTNSSFITARAVFFKGKSTYIAEMSAIGLAMEYLRKNVVFQEGDEIVVISDSRDALADLREKDESIVKQSKNDFYKITWMQLQEMKKTVPVKLKKFKGHLDEMNGNKVVDRLAKHSLRNRINIVDKERVEIQ